MSKKYILNLFKWYPWLKRLIYRSNFGEHMPSAEYDCKEKDLFKAMADKFNYGLSIFERDRIIYVNNRLTEISGYSSEELMQKSIFDLTIHDERKRVNTEMNRMQSVRLLCSIVYLLAIPPLINFKIFIK